MLVGCKKCNYEGFLRDPDGSWKEDCPDCYIPEPIDKHFDDDLKTEPQLQPTITVDILLKRFRDNRSVV